MAHTSAFLLTLLLLPALTPQFAHAWSAKCALGITECISLQGKQLPLTEVELIEANCRDFTRRNIGRIALNMSYKQIREITGERLSHPLLRASLAYEFLHNSELVFDRSLPIRQRYLPVKHACGFVFRALRTPPPEEEE